MDYLQRKLLHVLGYACPKMAERPADERAPLVAGPPPRARASRAMVAAALGLTVAAAWSQRSGRADGQASARGPHVDVDGSRSAVSLLAATVAPSPFPTGLTFAPTGGSPTFRPTIALKSYASPTLSPSGGSAIPTASVPVPTATLAAPLLQLGAAGNHR